MTFEKEYFCPIAVMDKLVICPIEMFDFLFFLCIINNEECAILAHWLQQERETEDEKKIYSH